MPDATPNAIKDPALSVSALVAAGRHAEAAARARALGDLQRAAELYERIWEFGHAAACAREVGDLPRALRNAVDARDEGTIAALVRALEEQGPDGHRAAMEIFAARRRFGDAGRHAEALDELATAVEHYRNAHQELDAARLLERMGRDREAGRLLERLVELSAPGHERARARLRLGHLLLRRMQYEAAARHLQEAVREQADTRQEARHALILALSGMGLRDAARDVLVDARADDPALPADLESFLRQERERRPALADAPAATAAAPASAADTPPGGDSRDVQMVGGRYRLDSLLGAGSTGRVYLAFDEVTDRQVAIKLFTLSRSHGAYERFVREARVTSALRHANLIEVYGFSADHGYLAMEYMAGGSLARRLSSAREGAGEPVSPMNGPAVRRLALDVLGGLEIAHQRGVIHRDVKPANIFFDARGTAKLGDFGVAHLLDLGQTQTGGLIGTLAYMSPEQITGADLTIAADLYALGVTLYQTLTGRLPFLGPDFVAQHLGETPPPPSSVAQISPAWDEVLDRALAKNPGERHDSVDAMRRQLLAMPLEERPRALILPRAGRARVASAAAADRSAADLDLSALLEPVAPAAPVADAGSGATAASEAADADDARYRFETPLGHTGISQLSRALDTVLNRSVIIERYEPGCLDEAAAQRLYALARGGSPFLQWALAHDRETSVVVFEAPAGAPLSEVLAERSLAPRDAVRLLMRLARAVAPLHERGAAHGALSETTVLLDEQDNPTLLVSGLGPVSADDPPNPRQDVDAIARLVARAAGMVPPAEPTAAGPAAPGDHGAAAHTGAAALVDLLAPDLDAARRAALLPLADADSGEALYTFAEALEIAILTTPANVSGPAAAR